MIEVGISLYSSTMIFQGEKNIFTYIKKFKTGVWCIDEVGSSVIKHLKSIYKSTFGLKL